MAKYVFCPWAPPVKASAKSDIARTVFNLTKGWNEERAAKGKAGYTLVFWAGVTQPPLVIENDNPSEDGKIMLTGEDQVYILGHHLAGLGYIADVDPRDAKEGKEKIFKLPHTRWRLDFVTASKHPKRSRGRSNSTIAKAV